jgi:hypothetical protein
MVNFRQLDELRDNAIWYRPKDVFVWKGLQHVFVEVLTRWG